MDSTTTPVAFLLLPKLIVFAMVREKTLRFVNFCAMASLRKEVCDDSRVSSDGSMVVEQYWVPRTEPLLKSGMVGMPISFKAPCM